MKTRSEVLREREAAKKAVEKAAAAPLPETKDLEPAPEGAMVRCNDPDCDAWGLASDCATRADGTAECSQCGGPVTLTRVNADENTAPEPAAEPVTRTRKTTKPAKTTEELAKEAVEKAERVEKLSPAPPRFCGSCGVPLTWAASTYFYPCGHTKEQHGMVNAPAESTVAKARKELETKGIQTMPIMVHREPEITAPTNRISVPWGKSRMPVDRWNSFEIGGYIVTVDLPPGADRVAETKKILGDLEKIAEEAFKVQFEWYKKKLLLLGVDGQ